MRQKTSTKLKLVEVVPVKNVNPKDDKVQAVFDLLSKSQKFDEAQLSPEDKIKLKLLSKLFQNFEKIDSNSSSKSISRYISDSEEFRNSDSVDAITIDIESEDFESDNHSNLSDKVPTDDAEKKSSTFLLSRGNSIDDFDFLGKRDYEDQTSYRYIDLHQAKKLKNNIETFQDEFSFDFFSSKDQEDCHASFDTSDHQYIMDLDLY